MAMPKKDAAPAPATPSRPRRLLRRALAVVAACVGLVLLATGIYLVWYFLRPQPEPTTRVLFPGVSYQRQVRAGSLPRVSHLVRVRLSTPGLRFLVTPPRLTAGRAFRAQTTSEFLARHRLRLAINGGYFFPYHSNNPGDFYPRSGDPVDTAGLSCSGTASSPRCSGPPARPGATLFVSCDHRLSLRRPKRLCGAVSGHALLRRGRFVARRPDGGRAPRTALGLDRERRFLLLLVVDGRQPGYSEGATLRELVRLLRAAGAHDAINMDGGGSSTLAANLRGIPRLLNSPIHTRLPGRERPVANHLGIYFASPSRGRGVQDLEAISSSISR
jgi:hypothetical protein